MEEPCTGWVPNHALCASWVNFSPDIQAYADRLATRVIWAATGRQFGLCDVTVRPCWSQQPALYQTFPVGYYGEGYWTLLGVSGGVIPVSMGGGCACASACGCSPPQVALPGPVDSVTTVTIDGAVLGAGNYRVDSASFLVRQDGQSWPANQDLSKAPGTAGTWTVRYQQGQPVPATLQDAAGLYACEVGKALTGGQCQLPNRVRSITRAGVEINYVNDVDFLDKGRTGYDQVDAIINSYNPYGLKQRPRVLSPDLPQYR